MMDGLKTSAAPKKNGLAGYKRIEIDLRQQVEGGRWPVGAMLPSRRDLARQYTVSLVTLDRAIGPLLADGTLRADDRRGTFVLKPPAVPPAQETREVSLSRISEQRLSDSGVGIRLAPLRLGQVGIITALTHDHSHEHFILHELEQILSHRGFSTTVLNRVQHPSRPRSLTDAAQSLLGEDLCALIVVCLDMDRVLIAEELSRVKLGETPAACILAGELNLPIPHVFYDNRSGGRQAAQHLLERGCREITVVAPFTASWVSERIAGVRDAVQAHGLPDCVRVLAGDGRNWEISEDPRPLGDQTMRAALAGGWRAGGGVICVSDGVAFGVLEAAAEWNLAAGRDFAILGFDDEPEARALGMTSLRPPMQGMAHEAVRLLLDQMQGAGTGFQVRLRAHVIPRASTRRLGL